MRYGSPPESNCIEERGERVCTDYFPHLSVEKLKGKTARGESRLPHISIEKSQKSARGVHIGDLASYIDVRRAEAMKSLR